MQERKKKEKTGGEGPRGDEPNATRQKLSMRGEIEPLQRQVRDVWKG